MGTFSLLVLVALCSCRPVVGSSLLEWMGISSWSNPNEKEVAVQDGVPLLKVPFEEATPEDKFLREAEKLVGLKSSALDTCQHKVAVFCFSEKLLLNFVLFTEMGLLICFISGGDEDSVIVCFHIRGRTCQTKC